MPITALASHGIVPCLSRTSQYRTLFAATTMSRINCQLPLRGERLFRERLLFNPRRAGGPGFFKTSQGFQSGEQPAFGPYFGNTQDEVENGIITYDNGRLIDGGRDSILASYLREGVMPPRGAQWTDCQLELVYLWLDAIASPYPNIEAVSYSSPMR